MTPPDLQIPERKDAPVVEDPAVVAGKEAAEAAAAWSAYAKAHPTLADEQTPEYKAIKERSETADDAFADAPVASVAGVLVKLRALGKDITEDHGPEGWQQGHVKTMTAFLEGFAGAPSVVADDHPDAALLALWQEWVPLMDRTNDTRTSDDERDTLGEQTWEIERRIIDTTPQTPVGLMALVKLLARYQEIGPGFTDQRERDLGRNILATLERLTPGLAEIGWGPVATVGPTVIESDTGIVFIDLDAKDIARELTDKSWADRAQFFNNAVVESLDTIGDAVEALGKKEKKPDTKEFLDMCMIAMHGRIGEVLDIWGLEAPPDEDAARVFALSGSPEHRTAAYVFCGSSQDAVDRLFKPATGLTVFKRMSDLSRPGLNELWREHVRGKKREGTAEPDPVVTMSAEWGSIYDEMTALSAANPDNKSGELMDRWEAALERVRALEDQILKTPASSMAGVVIKLRIATDRVCDSSNLGTLHAVPAREIDYKEQFGGEEWTSEFIISALLDTERLAGVS